MAKLTIVGGLPGAGKTRHLKEVSQHYDGLLVGDFMAGSVGGSSSFVDSQHFGRVISDLKSGRDCLIADLVFGREEFRREAELAVRRAVAEALLEWVFFENDPEAGKIRPEGRSPAKA